MMKLNKKGFTLVELLAVVVILLAISTVAVSSISAAIERNKEKQDNAKIEVILNHARLYYQSHRNTLTNKYGKNRACIMLGDLSDLTDEEKKYSSGELIRGVIIINNNKYIFSDDHSDCIQFKNEAIWGNYE